MATSSDPGGDHDWQSPDYVEDWIDRDVTRDEQRQPLLHRVAALIPATSGAPLEVLDVGGGYGIFTAAILEDRPDATVVLHDYSEAMIDKAKERSPASGTG